MLRLFLVLCSSLHIVLAQCCGCSGDGDNSHESGGLVFIEVSAFILIIPNRLIPIFCAGQQFDHACNPPNLEPICSARAVFLISQSAATTFDHVGSSSWFIHAPNIPILHSSVFLRSCFMVSRVGMGTFRHIPRWNQSITSCSSLTRSFKSNSVGRKCI